MVRWKFICLFKLVVIIFVVNPLLAQRCSRLIHQNCCQFRGTTYFTGERVSFNNRNKVFDCICRTGGRLDCTWTHVTPVENTRCYDRATGSMKYSGQTWERIRGGKIFDCLCSRGASGMQVSCSDENRCHHDGISYKAGTNFTTNSISGRTMKCQCRQKKKLSCRYSEELPSQSETNSQWVENYVVTGGKVLQPQITTLQACRTGARVVTNGAVWNQTNTNALGVRTLEQCTCVDAIVRCRTVRIISQIEPHCLSLDGRFRKVGQRWLRSRQRLPSQEFLCQCHGNEDIRCRRTRVSHCVDDSEGEIRNAGDRWIRTHETLRNLQFECTCNSNRKITCQDIGKCDEPSATANGALLCANVGRAGPEQVVYCKPMCLQDYEFINPQRYYRIWEVCGSMNLHRWSGGFVGDPDAIARCRARGSGTKRGHQNLYLPTNDCQGMTEQEIDSQKSLFLRQLHYRNLCGNKCEVTLFKCGEKVG